MQPVLEARAAVRADDVLAEVEPVLDGAPVPAPLPRPVQAHVLAPAAHLPTARVLSPKHSTHMLPMSVHWEPK